MLASAALAVGTLGVAGCGDDEGDTEVTIPTIESPTEETDATAPTTTTPESGGVTPGDDSGTGGTAPEGSGGTGTSQEDTATNDTPPAPGSPESAFEEQCKQNPQACG